MSIQWLIVSALILIASMSFFVIVPAENMDIVKTIVTAFIAYLTGYVSGKFGGKSEKVNSDLPDSNP